MATLTFQNVSVANGTLTKTYTLSEADNARFIAAMKILFNQPTAPAALLAWADDVVARGKNTIQTIEQVQPNPPISPT